MLNHCSLIPTEYTLIKQSISMQKVAAKTIHYCNFNAPAQSHIQGILPYNGNRSQKNMFANFANPGVFANIFLLNFHFLVFSVLQLRGEGLAGLNIVQ